MMRDLFERIEPVRIADRVASEIENAILTGALRPGATLSSDALARQFNVSHIPVREALQKLEAMGLIVREANKSARIIDMSQPEIHQVFQVRQTLEGLAASLAAPRLDGRVKQRLQTLVTKMRACTKTKDYPKLLAADKEFHETIWRLSDNRFLVTLLSNLVLPYFAHLASRGYHVHQGEQSYVPRVHQEILDALATGDGQHAEQVIVGVLERSRKLMPVQGPLNLSVAEPESI